jgi:hypothetical protein
MTNNHQPTPSTNTDYATGSPRLQVQDHDRAKPPHAEGPCYDQAKLHRLDLRGPMILNPLRPVDVS